MEMEIHSIWQDNTVRLTLKVGKDINIFSIYKSEIASSGLAGHCPLVLYTVC